MTLTGEQRDSLLNLGAALKARGNHGWLFARLADGVYREVEHLVEGDEGAIVFIIIPRLSRDWVRIGLRPRFAPGATGWFRGGSKSFRADKTLVDIQLGVEFAIGRMEKGGFHISKRNFSTRWVPEDSGPNT